MAAVGAVVVAAIAPAGATGGDPDLRHQRGLHQIGAPHAWSVARGSGVIVAVVDTGVDADHPDLRSKLLPGWNASRRTNAGTQDDRGHGTHVAGTAAAATGNGVGIAGAAPDAMILPVKVLDGTTPADAALEIELAIAYAVDHGARVINLSVTSIAPDLPVSDLEGPCNRAFARGALCVVAAGNRGPGHPSGFRYGVDAVVVSAVDGKGAPAAFSQPADTKWGVAAPGVDVHATVPTSQGSYGSKSGTSMAAPHVSGVAALLFGQGLDAGAVAARLVSTAATGSGAGGAPIVDAAAAVGAPRAEPPVPGPQRQSASAASPPPERDGVADRTLPPPTGAAAASSTSDAAEDSAEPPASAAPATAGPVARPARLRSMPSRTATDADQRSEALTAPVLFAFVAGAPVMFMLFRRSRRRGQGPVVGS